MKVRHVLVHINGHPFALVKHFARIVFDIVDLFSQEKTENSVRSFSYGSQSCQKVAVSKVALLDVSGIRLVNKDSSVRDFAGDSFPLDAIPFRDASPFSTERVLVGRESVISELLSSGSELFDLFLGWGRFNLDDLLFDDIAHLSVIEVEPVVNLEILLLMLVI